MVWCESKGLESKEASHALLWFECNCIYRTGSLLIQVIWVVEKQILILELEYIIYIAKSAVDIHPAYARDVRMAVRVDQHLIGTSYGEASARRCSTAISGIW